jgi:hypothetical protein
LHRIDGSGLLAELAPLTKIDPSRPLVEKLLRLGRDAADDWLQLGAARRRPREMCGSRVATRRATPPAVSASGSGGS